MLSVFKCQNPDVVFWLDTLRHGMKREVQHRHEVIWRGAVLKYCLFLELGNMHVLSNLELTEFKQFHSSVTFGSLVWCHNEMLAMEG